MFFDWVLVVVGGGGGLRVVRRVTVRLIVGVVDYAGSTWVGRTVVRSGKLEWWEGSFDGC